MNWYNINKKIADTLEPLLSVHLSYGHLCLPDTNKQWMTVISYQTKINE